MTDLLKLVEGARRLRPNTKRGYANVVRQWLDFAGADPRSWTAATCQAFYDQLVTRVSTTTANVMLGGLSWVLARAAALDPHAGVADVTQAVDRYRANSDAGDGAPIRRHALTAPQARKLLDACAGDDIIDLRDHAMALLGFYTGMRRMSLVAVDLDKVIDRGTFVTLDVPIKGGSTYRVPLDIRAWRQLDRYQAALAAFRRSAGPRPLFPSFRQPRPTAADPLGRREVSPRAMTEDGAYHALGQRAKAAGLTAFSPHLFRHTFSTWCRADRVPDYLIEVVTGHKSNRGMVDRVYTDRDALHADVARQCYEAVNRRLTGADT